MQVGSVQAVLFEQLQSKGSEDFNSVNCVRALCVCALHVRGGAHLGMLAVPLAVDGCVEGFSSDNPRLPVSHG